MQGLKVLVADDDAQVRELVRLYLSREGATVLLAEDGAQALNLAGSHPVDAVILDVMMPELDGFAVCRELRRTSEVPVLMLTAKGEEIDRVLGLELGADDYVVKPFSPRELMARLKAVLRRTRSQQQPAAAPPAAVLSFPGLEVNLQAREVTVPDGLVPLAPREFDLLAFLVQNPRVVLAREVILEKVWGYDFPGDTRTVDVHVNKLRRKLGKVAGSYIHTVWGVGYKFEVDARTGD